MCRSLMRNSGAVENDARWARRAFASLHTVVCNGEEDMMLRRYWDIAGHSDTDCRLPILNNTFRIHMIGQMVTVIKKQVPYSLALTSHHWSKRAGANDCDVHTCPHVGTAN